MNDSNAGLLGGLDNPGFNSTETEYEAHGVNSYEPDVDFDTSYENDEDDGDVRDLEDETLQEEDGTNFSRNLLLKSFRNHVSASRYFPLIIFVNLNPAGH